MEIDMVYTTTTTTTTTNEAASANRARAYLCMKMTLHSSPESATLLRLSVRRAVRLVCYGLLDSP